MPTVSVIMPVYNGEEYVAPAIESILNQTYTDYELIIIDDGSTDGTAQIIKQYQDQRIRYVRHTVNQRLIATLNEGIELAQGAYLARMDADDVSCPDRLLKQYQYLESNQEVGVVGTAIALMDKQGRLGGKVNFPARHSHIQWSMYFLSPFAHPSVMGRTELFRAAAGYDAKRVHVEDYDLWLRLADTTHLHNLPDVLLHLRKHEGNITKIAAVKHLNNANQMANERINEMLNTTVDKEVVCCMRGGGGDLQLVKQSVALVKRLLAHHLARVKGDTVVLNDIRRDAAWRIAVLGLKSGSFPGAVVAFVEAVLLDVTIPARLAVSFGKRI